MTTITEEATEAAVSAVNEYIAAQSAADPDFDAGDFYTPAHRQGLAGHVCATILAAQARDGEPRCIACDQPLKAGELVLDDASGGIIHRDCCGPEREAYTGEDGGPLKDGEPIPSGWAWEPDPRPSVDRKSFDEGWEAGKKYVQLRPAEFALVAPQAEGRDTGGDSMAWFNACWKISGTGMSKRQFIEKYKKWLGISGEVADRMARALSHPDRENK